jgi:anti-anti-sigma regulatory factor
MDTQMLFPGFTAASMITERGMIVQIAGPSSISLDHGTQLKSELLRICAASPKLLVLDLAELIDVTSAVLGALLLCRRLTSAYGGTLRLAGVRPSVMEVLRRSALIQLFDCWPDRESALAGE